MHVVLLKLKLKCVTYEQCEIIKFCLNFSGQTPSIDTLAMEHRVNIQLKRYETSQSLILVATLESFEVYFVIQASDILM